MIVAERMLYIETKAARVPVAVRIELPSYEREAWTCNFSIGWPEGTAHHYGMGADGVQALHSALRIIAIHLYASPYHRQRTLVFDEPGDGYGFPLPVGSRDQALGHDKSL